MPVAAAARNFNHNNLSISVSLSDSFHTQNIEHTRRIKCPLFIIDDRSSIEVNTPRKIRSLALAPSPQRQQDSSRNKPPHKYRIVLCYRNNRSNALRQDFCTIKSTIVVNIQVENAPPRPYKPKSPNLARPNGLCLVPLCLPQLFSNLLP